MEREIGAEYELNEIDGGTLHGSVGSRLSLFAREFKWRSSSSALRLPNNCYGSSFVIDPNGRYVRKIELCELSWKPNSAEKDYSNVAFKSN